MTVSMGKVSLQGSVAPVRLRWERVFLDCRCSRARERVVVFWLRDDGVLRLLRDRIVALLAKLPAAGNDAECDGFAKLARHNGKPSICEVPWELSVAPCAGKLGRCRSCASDSSEWAATEHVTQII